MSVKAADILVETLVDWEIDVIFGMPGDGINGIMEALRARQEKIRFVQVRHEESAAFMACAWAKYTGRLGCCLATSGPGGLHLLNGLYDAKLDGQPVLAITGLPYHDLINTHTQQDVELDKVFMDVAVYNARIMGPAHVRQVVDLACRTALTYKGVSHITMPVDLQSEELQQKSQSSKRNIGEHTSDIYARVVAAPEPAAIVQAAEVLNRGEKIVILAGRGANHATDELIAVAEKLGAPIAKALLGKSSVPDASPYTTGCIGLLGTRPSQEAMEECDTLLMVGTSFPYLEFLPEPGQARAIQIDTNPVRIGQRYPVDIGIAADSRLTLRALIPHLDDRPKKEFFAKIRGSMDEWNRLMEERGTSREKPMKPQVIAWELGKRLTDTAIVSSDSGTITTWWARQLPARKGQMYSCSGTLATMACGLPYTIAAQIAYPERQCVAFVGDGAFTMLMGEFLTAVKYDLPVKIIVVKNNSLGMIKWEQMVFLGNPEYGCELQPMDFVGFARACGAEGYRIDDPSECGDILDVALGNGKPTVIEAVVDPFVPPMPGKISADQAMHFAQSLVRGQPYAGKIALTVASDKVRELV